MSSCRAWRLLPEMPWQGGPPQMKSTSPGKGMSWRLRPGGKGSGGAEGFKKKVGWQYSWLGTGGKERSSCSFDQGPTPEASAS